MQALIRGGSTNSSKGGGGFWQEFFKGGVRVLEKASPWEFPYTDKQKKLGGGG